MSDGLTGKIYDTVGAEIRAETGNYAIIKCYRLHKAMRSWGCTMEMVDESLIVELPLLTSN